MRHLFLLVATGLVGSALVAPPAGAAPTWQPVTNLFANLSAAGGSSFTPSIGIDAAGNATVAWSRWNGTQYVVQASYRPVGGAWSAPVDLAGGRMVIDPQLVVDPAGNATVIWRNVEADRSVVQTASRTAAGTWSVPVDLSTDTSVDYSQRDVPQVAVDPAGQVTATWSRFEAAPGQPWRYTAQTATRATDGTWSAPVDLSPAGSPARTTDVAIDPAGNATATWVAGSTVQAASRPAGGTWSAPVQLSAAAGMRANPRVVVDPAGTATAVWGSFSGGAYGVQTASRPLGGAWTTVDLATGEIFDTPAIAVDRLGVATAVWQAHDGSGWIVTSASRAPGGAWSTPVPLSTPERDSWDPQVAVDPTGTATAIWSRADDGGRVIEAARRDAGGEWSEPIDLSPRGDAWNPQIAVDATGNATAAWARKDGTSYIVQARGLDAAGPVVTGLSAQATGNARGTQAYRVSAYDVWSRVSSATWRFADGTTATGTSVTHDAASSSAGPVRVTLTDSVGNATVCTYTGTYACRPTTRVAPAITRASIKHRKIRAVGSRGEARKKARVKVVLTTDAKVELVFKKAGTKRKVRVTKRGDAGKNAFTVRARIAKHKVLRPGRWTITVRATNKVGASAKEKLRLRVVR